MNPYQLDAALASTTAASREPRVSRYGWPTRRAKRRKRRHLAHVATRKARQARKATPDHVDSFPIPA